MDLFVLSYNRPNSQTLTALQNEGIQAIMVIYPEQMDAYTTAFPLHDVLLYTGTKGVVNKRVFVAEHCEARGIKWAGVFDDDITTIFHWCKQKTTWKALIEAAEAQMRPDVWSIKLQSLAFLRPDVKPGITISYRGQPPWQVGFFNFELMNARGIKYDASVRVLEDTHIGLQAIRQGLPLIKLNEWSHKALPSGGKKTVAWNEPKLKMTEDACNAINLLMGCEVLKFDPSHTNLYQTDLNALAVTPRWKLSSTLPTINAT